MVIEKSFGGLRVAFWARARAGGVGYTGVQCGEAQAVEGEENLIYGQDEVLWDLIG